MAISHARFTSPTPAAALPRDGHPGDQLAVRIRPATAADADAVADLVSLVDLHRPAEELPAVLDKLRALVSHQFPDGALSHGLNHILIAEDNGLPVGLARCGPTEWMVDGDEISEILRGRVLRRVSFVCELAVSPEFRNRGIARALLRQAEHDMRADGYGVLVLRHERSLERFYRHLGYTSASRLTMDLPLQGRMVRIDRGWRYAVKPLAPEVSIDTVHGNPVVTGILTR